MELTPLEREILNHRLEVPDAIADGIEASSDDDVSAACDTLIAGNYEAAKSDPLVARVLVDAVEGSTYYGASVGRDSPQKLAAIEKAGNSLARKVGELLNREGIVFPCH